VAQQTLTSLHRLRSSWVVTRTARLNTLRGLLRELGSAIPVGAKKVIPFPASDCLLPLLSMPSSARSVASSTARHFASYLGSTPREHSSGNVRRLGRISKRGDAYLRTLLTHGARAVLRAAHTCRTVDLRRSEPQLRQKGQSESRLTGGIQTRIVRRRCLEPPLQVSSPTLERAPQTQANELPP
jgi:hypothetical protein